MYLACLRSNYSVTKSERGRLGASYFTEVGDYTLSVVSQATFQELFPLTKRSTFQVPGVGSLHCVAVAVV